MAITIKAYKVVEKNIPEFGPIFRDVAQKPTLPDRGCNQLRIPFGRGMANVSLSYWMSTISPLSSPLSKRFPPRKRES